jgi:Zn-dependent hydrolases, including glyoxylases
MHYLNLGYDSTNYYLLLAQPKALLVDIGFPQTLAKLQHRLNSYDLQLKQIGYLLVTHYHPDHAGLAQELKNAGLTLIVLEEQLAAIPQLGGYLKAEHNYQPIRLDDNRVISFAESRAFLASIGIQGEIIATPGHSDDSLSLILDDGKAFTGDLPPPYQADEAGGQVLASWRTILAKGAQQIYPGHGPVIQRSYIQRLIDAL